MPEQRLWMHLGRHGRLLWKFFKGSGWNTTTEYAICPGSKGLFVPVLEPGFGRRDKSLQGFCPGW